jgi:hypothetical protein
MEKWKLKLKDQPLLIIVISVCLIISILLPLASYLNFENSLNSKTQSYNLNISSAQEENEGLKQEIANLTQQLGVAEDPLLSKQYFVTSLGWYLHKSSDPVAGSANTFTIYGNILNVGATDANCSLIVKFYNSKDTLLQTSSIPVGEMLHWANNNIDPKSIPCSVADSVTRIEVDPTVDNVP